MSRKGFVDNNLFGLKDKLRNYPINEEAEEEANVSMPKSQTKKEQTDRKSDEECERIKPGSRAPDNGTDNAIEHIEHKGKENIIVDKEYFKALVERKKEFTHKKNDILKRIKENLEKLPIDIERYEKQLAESKKIKEKLTFLVETIDTINEKEWDKKDFSLDLANAMKKVENSRLELFTLQQKTNCLLEDNIPGLEKNQNSFVPELTSLSPGQIFKLGASFFFPLIIGLLLTGLLISITMLAAMGVI